MYLKDDDEARSRIVRAAEIGAINSSDIVPVFREFKNPSHEEFAEPTRWSFLNAFTETIKKYTPQRVDCSYAALNRSSGLDSIAKMQIEIRHQNVFSRFFHQSFRSQLNLS